MANPAILCSWTSAQFYRFNIEDVFILTHLSINIDLDDKNKHFYNLFRNYHWREGQFSGFLCVDRSYQHKTELHIYYSKNVLGLICNRKKETETATAISSLPDSNSKKLARFQIHYNYVHAKWCYKPCHTLPDHNYELKTQNKKKKIMTKDSGSRSLSVNC